MLCYYKYEHHYCHEKHKQRNTSSTYLHVYTVVYECILMFCLKVCSKTILLKLRSELFHDLRRPHPNHHSPCVIILEIS